MFSKKEKRWSRELKHGFFNKESFSYMSVEILCFEKHPRINNEKEKLTFLGETYK